MNSPAEDFAPETSALRARTSAREAVPPVTDAGGTFIRIVSALHPAGREYRLRLPADLAESELAQLAVRVRGRRLSSRRFEERVRRAMRGRVRLVVAGLEEELLDALTVDQQAAIIAAWNDAAEAGKV